MKSGLTLDLIAFLLGDNMNVTSKMSVDILGVSEQHYSDFWCNLENQKGRWETHGALGIYLADPWIQPQLSALGRQKRGEGRKQQSGRERSLETPTATAPGGVWAAAVRWGPSGVPSNLLQDTCGMPATSWATLLWRRSHRAYYVGRRIGDTVPLAWG